MSALNFYFCIFRLKRATDFKLKKNNVLIFVLELFKHIQCRRFRSHRFLGFVCNGFIVFRKMRYRKRYSINDENCAKIWNFTFIYIHCINHLLTPYPQISQKTDDLRRGPIPLEIESLCVICFVLFPLLSFLIRSDRSDSG